MIEIRANYVGGTYDVPVRIFAMWYDLDGSGWFSYQVIGHESGKMLTEEMGDFTNLHRFVPGRKKMVEQPDEVLP